MPRYAVLWGLMVDQKFLRESQLVSTKDKPGRYPFSKPTLWRWVREGRFPRPVRLGSNLIAWNVDDLAEWERACAEASR